MVRPRGVERRAGGLHRVPVALQPVFIRAGAGEDRPGEGADDQLAARTGAVVEGADLSGDGDLLTQNGRSQLGQQSVGQNHMQPVLHAGQASHGQGKEIERDTMVLVGEDGGGFQPPVESDTVEVSGGGSHGASHS